MAKTADSPIEVLLVDDQSVSRRSVRILLEPEVWLSIVGEAADGLKAICLARRLRPQLLIMDVSMPNMCGGEAAKILVEEMPEIRVILVGAMIVGNAARSKAVDSGASLLLDRGRLTDE